MEVFQRDIDHTNRCRSDGEIATYCKFEKVSIEMQIDLVNAILEYYMNPKLFEIVHQAQTIWKLRFQGGWRVIGR